jgi:hypothetical protein
VIELLPDIVSESGTDLQVLNDRLNQVITAVNRLTELARLGLGSTGRDENVKFPSTAEGDQQFAENRLTWPEDTRSQKGIERDIKRREKP